jgi:hypoxanthine phosphoribosyltransferase
MHRPEQLLSAETIAARVRELGARITAEYQGEELAVVSVLAGSFVFAADLVRHIELPLSVDFLGVRSYGDETTTSGVVRLTHDLVRPIADKHVLLVEDIVDTGLTVRFLMDTLRARSPRSLRLASLLHKPARSRVAVSIDYLGFTIEDVFVVGYGLDAAQKYRNLPYLGVVQE